MKKTFLALALFGSFSASASDNWDVCKNAFGDVTLENGTLVIEGIGETSFSALEVIQEVTKEEQTCKLKGSGQEVVSYDNTVSVEKVTYTTEETDPPTSVYLICERGGSGIPAGDSCQE